MRKLFQTILILSLMFVIFSCKNNNIDIQTIELFVGQEVTLNLNTSDEKQPKIKVTNKKVIEVETSVNPKIIALSPGISRLSLIYEERRGEYDVVVSEETNEIPFYWFRR